MHVIFKWYQIIEIFLLNCFWFWFSHIFSWSSWWNNVSVNLNGEKYSIWGDFVSATSIAVYSQTGDMGCGGRPEYTKEADCVVPKCGTLPLMNHPEFLKGGKCSKYLWVFGLRCYVLCTGHVSGSDFCTVENPCPEGEQRLDNPRPPTGELRFGVPPATMKKGPIPPARKTELRSSDKPPFMMP